jgi:hypothetical protein
MLKRLVTALVFSAVALLLATTTKWEVTLSGNETTRLATVQTLVEQGTFSIDRSDFVTVDRVSIGGRFYSDKPLFLAAWLSLLYLPLHQLLGWDFSSHYHELIYLLGLVGVGSFSLLLAVLFYRRMRQEGRSWVWALAAAVALIFSTWIFSFGTSINNHTPAACVCFALAWTLWGGKAPLRGRRALAAGLLAGVLFNLDLPTGGLFFAGGLVFIAVASKRRRRTALVGFAAGFAGPVAMMAGLHYAAYGNPLPAYLVPGAFDFPSNIHTSQIAGLHRPERPIQYLFHATLGQRGLFSHQPVLLLSLPYLLWRRPGRARALTPALIAVAAILFYGTQTGDYGGWAYGFRFLVPLIPLFFWWACGWLAGVPGGRRLALLAPILAIGVVSAALGAYNPWPVCYEGSATAPGAVEEEVRWPVAANLLCWSFEHRMEWFSPLAERIYGEDLARVYLAKSFRNVNRRDLFERVRRWRPGEPSTALGKNE